jgi:hypothetical protein
MSALFPTSASHNSGSAGPAPTPAQAALAAAHHMAGSVVGLGPGGRTQPCTAGKGLVAVMPQPRLLRGSPAAAAGDSSRLRALACTAVSARALPVGASPTGTPPPGPAAWVPSSRSRSLQLPREWAGLSRSGNDELVVQQSSGSESVAVARGAAGGLRGLLTHMGPGQAASRRALRHQGSQGGPAGDERQ